MICQNVIYSRGFKILLDRDGESGIFGSKHVKGMNDFVSLHKELNFSSAVGSIADEACPGFSFAFMPSFYTNLHRGVTPRGSDRSYL